MNDATVPTFLKILTDKFPHAPTLKQDVALNKLANFVLGKQKDNVFLLKGFAGTGKNDLGSHFGE
jgi:exodeoxyribonuclease-5